VIRVRARRGRTFTDSDAVSGVPVVLVNEDFVEKFWPNESAVGKRIRLVKDRAAQPWLTVIGVLPNIRQNPRRPLENDPLIYLPYQQEPQREMFLVAQTQVPAQTLATPLRREVQKIDSNLALYDIGTVDSHLAKTRLETSILGGMFSVFAGLALVLAAIGLYAVISHGVSQRTQEIGIRMALGGTQRDILRLVYMQGLRPLVIGMMLGLPAALGVTHILRTTLIGVSPGDPLTLLAVVLVLTAAGVAGCAVPARRAVRVDAIVALRYE
jgi:putative ABC transport system permease protein